MLQPLVTRWLKAQHLWGLTVAEPGPSIVLIDDEPVTRTAIRRLLEGAGFEVRAEAADADAAIEVSIRARPRICPVDLFMPG